MAIERTISIIKPDGVAKNIIGEICRRFEERGLQIIAAQMMRLSKEQAEQFYAVHQERPFYVDLVHRIASELDIPAEKLGSLFVIEDAFKASIVDWRSRQRAS